MIRTLKTLGVAFVAVLAFSAVAATTASAEGELTCGNYPCTFTGSNAAGIDTFTTEAGKVECDSAFHGTIGEAVSNIRIKATYTNCVAFGFVNSTVHMNGCEYEFTTATQITSHEWTSGAGTSTTPTNEVTHLVCPAGKSVEITAATCRVQIHPQTLHGHLIITNTTEPTPDDIDVRGTYEGIDYTVTQDGFGCTFSGTGAKDGATYIQDKEVTIHAIHETTGLPTSIAIS